MSHPWRSWLLALCAFGLVMTVVCSLRVVLRGHFGLSGTPTSTPFVDRLTVRPGSAAQKAGIVDGDLLDWHDLPAWERFRLTNGASFDGGYVGERVVLRVVRGSRAHDVAVVVRDPDVVAWQEALFLTGMFWILAFCTLLAWRRSESLEARLLILFLLVQYVVQEGFVQTTTPWPLLDYVCRQLSNLLFAPSIVLLAVYASCFGKPVSGLRRTLIVVAAAAAAAFSGIAFFERWSVWHGAGDPLNAAWAQRYWVWRRFALGAEVIAVAASLLLAYRAARGAERTRFAWAVAAVGPPLLWVFVIVVADQWIPRPLYYFITALCWFAVPAVLSYSLLNRRLFDIGFVVNRAAVFTGVSLLLLGTFVLVEWLVTDWLRNASHAANLLVSGGVALALGLSIRFVHGRVDRFVDSVFFRKRHEDERAIRTFAREAAYITDPHILLQRTIETLTLHTNAASVEVMLEYDENDPAALRLRAMPQILDLHGFDTQLRGDIAFPMTSRGRLLGIIVLGPRRSAEIYAPDETAAIALLAESVAAALDVLQTRDGRSDVLERIVASVESLREELVRRLPPAHAP